MPRKKTPQPCACGCGEMTRGGQWLQGHDAQYMSRVHEAVERTFRPENVTKFIGMHMLGLCRMEALNREIDGE